MVKASDSGRPMPYTRISLPRQDFQQLPGGRRGRAQSDSLRILSALIELWKIPFLVVRGFEGPPPSTTRTSSLALHPPALRRIPLDQIFLPNVFCVRIIGQQKGSPTPLALLSRGYQTPVPQVVMKHRRRRVRLFESICPTARPAVHPLLRHQIDTHRVPFDVAGATEEVLFDPDDEALEPALRQMYHNPVLALLGNRTSGLWPRFIRW